MYRHILLLSAVVTVVTALPINDGAAGEHIQHVTIPPSSPTIASNSHIQRVSSIQTSRTESTTKAQPLQRTLESNPEESTEHMEGTTIPQTTSEDDITTDVPVTVDIEEIAIVPREDLKMPVDDLETANFFWGLGPVYPHLYQFKRVPHLVPIHSWNPYHDYYTYHKKFPTQYSF